MKSDVWHEYHNANILQKFVIKRNILIPFCNYVRVGLSCFPEKVPRYLRTHSGKIKFNRCSLSCTCRRMANCESEAATAAGGVWRFHFAWMQTIIRGGVQEWRSFGFKIVSRHSCWGLLRKSHQRSSSGGGFLTLTLLSMQPNIPSNSTPALTVRSLIVPFRTSVPPQSAPTAK